MTTALKVLLTVLIGVAVFLAAAAHEEPEGGSTAPSLDSVRVERITSHIGPRGLEPAQVLHRRLTLVGRGFQNAAGGPSVHFRFADGRNVPSPLVFWRSDRRITAWVPEICRGTARVELRNPDGGRASVIVDL